MEFYLNFRTIEIIFPSGFNSQRDGILHLDVWRDARRWSFQFPTGWNSTKSYVRIAPGAAWAFQFPTGWNSTKRAGRARLDGGVSIPNGMEFYPVVDIAAIAQAGFNSQRDGILHEFYAVVPLKVGVSIPNGMEFYKSDLATYRGLRIVSIPNGMEFYFGSSQGAHFARRFNSQRDGILLRWRARTRSRKFVSIPNGMEFYFKRYGRTCFQIFVSIPNGMEFYRP